MTITRTSIIRVAAIVLALLCIPLILTIRDGAVEGVGWNWTTSDFVIMGTLLFVTGLAIESAVRTITAPVSKIVTVLAIVLVFLLMWVQLAVQGVSQLIQFLLG